MKQPCDIEILSDISEAKIRWEAMQTSGAATPFQSYAWASAMARTLARTSGAEMFAAFAVDPATGRDLILLPFMRRRLRLLTLIESPDFGLADYCGPLLSSEIADEPHRFPPLWRALLAALPKADLLRLGKVPASYDGRPNALLQLDGIRPKSSHSWGVALPERWAAYEANVLSSKFRSNMRRARRLLDSCGAVSFAEAVSDGELDRNFTALLTQRRTRFDRIGRPDSLSDPHRAAFYRLLLTEGRETGLASLMALRLDGEVIATLLGLNWRDRFLALIPTMTESLPKTQAPGKVMTWTALNHLHAGGCRYFDFTNGDEPYKRDFGAVPNQIYELTQALRLRGRPVALGIATRTNWKRWRDGLDRPETAPSASPA